MEKDITHANSPTKPEQLMPIYRRIMRIGNSDAITLPPAWVRRHVKPDCRIALLVTNPDGTITVEPFIRPVVPGAISAGKNRPG